MLAYTFVIKSYPLRSFATEAGAGKQEYYFTFQDATPYTNQSIVTVQASELIIKKNVIQYLTGESFKNIFIYFWFISAIIRPQ